MNRLLCAIAGVLFCGHASAQVLYGPAAIHGGTIDGATITNSNIATSQISGAVTLSDSGPAFIAAASPTIPSAYTVALFDPTANAISATIQACNSGSKWDQEFKDATGSAAIHTITLTPAAGTIDGASSVQIGSAYAAIHIHSNGGVCVIL